MFAGIDTAFICDKDFMFDWYAILDSSIDHKCGTACRRGSIAVRSRNKSSRVDEDNSDGREDIECMIEDNGVTQSFVAVVGHCREEEDEQGGLCAEENKNSLLVAARGYRGGAAI